MRLQVVRSVAESAGQRIAAFGRASAATASVEFAILGNLFVLLLMGTLCYGMYLGAAHGVAQLAADAARASLSGLTDAERIQLAQSHVSRNAASYVLLQPDKLTVKAGPTSDPNQFDVTVSYDASQLPIWVAATLLPLPGKTITRSASIVRGGY